MAKPADAYDYTSKIITLGDSAVGKTCLLIVFSKSNYIFKKS